MNCCESTSFGVVIAAAGGHKLHGTVTDILLKMLYYSEGVVREASITPTLVPEFDRHLVSWGRSGELTVRYSGG